MGFLERSDGPPLDIRWVTLRYFIGVLVILMGVLKTFDGHIENI